jgi:hypothetical protein
VTPWRAALLAVMTAACVACATHRPTPAHGTGAPVEYVRRNFQSSLAGCEDPTRREPAPCVRVDIQYVEATRASAALARAVTVFVRTTVLAPFEGGQPAMPSVEALRDALYDAYRERQRIAPGYRIPWVLERSVKVACNTARLQGLAGSEQSFTGGAHPSEDVQYRTLDTEIGARIGLDAVIAPEHRAAFAAEVERRFRGVRNIPPGQSLHAAGFTFPGGQFAVSDNVLICPDAITVRWNRAEVAPGSFGATDVTVPRSDVAALLRPGAP